MAGLIIGEGRLVADLITPPIIHTLIYSPAFSRWTTVVTLSSTAYLGLFLNCGELVGGR